jgi:UDP-glucose 4-epimerase
MKTILITGATGFLGSHTSKHYINAGFKVIGTGTKPEKDISYSGLAKYSQIILPDDRLHDLIKKYRPDICIHCAGSSSISLSIEDPQKDFDINVPVIFNLMEGLRKYSPECKTVFLSSAAVYGNPLSLPINEKNPIKPISPYGFHKNLCENICKEYSILYNLKIDILRIFSAYGPGLKKQIFWDICNKIKKEKKLILFGTGQETRDFLYIQDVIIAIGIVLEKSDRCFEIFNLASGKETSIQNLAGLMLKELNYDTEVKFNGIVRKGDPLRWKADISKLSALGFKPEVSIEEGVRKYCQWLVSEV